MQGLFTFCCLVLLLVRYLGFITEGNTFRCCATSSSPLGGNTDVVLANIIKGISSAVAEEDLQHNQVPNHKSHLLPIYIICHLPLVFLSPTSQKISLLFASLFHSSFSRQICFCVQSCLLPLLVLPCAFYLLASALAKNLLIWTVIHLLIFSKDLIMLNQLLGVECT